MHENGAAGMAGFGQKRTLPYSLCLSQIGPQRYSNRLHCWTKLRGYGAGLQRPRVIKQPYYI